ncbi:22367_t:CDS:2 [Entrophospora sp. SA101]|nr:22367_t:CDS:2 [Entrophospora sp. SA101]
MRKPIEMEANTNFNTADLINDLNTVITKVNPTDADGLQEIVADADGVYTQQEKLAAKQAIALRHSI